MLLESPLAPKEYITSIKDFNFEFLSLLVSKRFHVAVRTSFEFSLHLINVACQFAQVTEINKDRFNHTVAYNNVCPSVGILRSEMVLFCQKTKTKVD